VESRASPPVMFTSRKLRPRAPGTGAPTGPRGRPCRTVCIGAMRTLTVGTVVHVQQRRAGHADCGNAEYSSRRIPISLAQRVEEQTSATRDLSRPPACREHPRGRPRPLDNGSSPRWWVSRSRMLGEDTYGLDARGANPSERPRPYACPNLPLFRCGGASCCSPYPSST
jgi:hypothetical protein